MVITTNRGPGKQVKSRPCKAGFRPVSTKPNLPKPILPNALLPNNKTVKNV
jgi:hypothetical protein